MRSFRLQLGIEIDDSTHQIRVVHPEVVAAPAPARVIENQKNEGAVNHKLLGHVSRRKCKRPDCLNIVNRRQDSYCGSECRHWGMTQKRGPHKRPVVLAQPQLENHVVKVNPNYVNYREFTFPRL
jgi:hypothetical protein